MTNYITLKQLSQRPEIKWSYSTLLAYVHRPELKHFFESHTKSWLKIEVKNIPIFISIMEKFKKPETRGRKRKVRNDK